MKSKRIGVLMGGLSAERSVSMESGEAVYEALASRGHDVTRILVDRDIDQTLRESSIEVAFNALHGTYGEDGCIQGLLEMLRIPYTGSGVLASALAMDKLKAKELFRLHNVPTPPYYDLGRADLENLERLHGSFGFPAFVKPRRAGSSVGAGRANNLHELESRVRSALRFDRRVLVERHIVGREIAVGVLDGKALGAIEIVPRGKFYDYDSKYSSGQSDYHFPARLSPTRYKGVLNLAEQAHKSIGATGATRIDMLVTEGQNEFVLEVNTLPGMTPTSLLPKIAAGSGYDFADLCEAILNRADLDVMDQPTGSASTKARGASETVSLPAEGK